MKKKLYTGYNEYEDIARSMEFEVVSEVPEVGDAWGSTCEVTGVTEVSLDNNENDKSYPDHYKAYRVEHINRGDEDTLSPGLLIPFGKCSGIKPQAARRLWRI